MCKKNLYENQNITILHKEIKWNKMVSIIQFNGEFNINLKELLVLLKKKLGTGGTIKNGYFELQGNHSERIQDILISYGLPKKIISIR